MMMIGLLSLPRLQQSPVREPTTTLSRVSMRPQPILPRRLKAISPQTLDPIGFRPEHDVRVRPPRTH